MKEEAIKYALRGWPVLPVHSVDSYSGGCTCLSALCREVGKHPILSKSRYKEASKDVAQVILWWALYPNANVSVRTGFHSGLIVIDIDPKKGGQASLERLMEKRFGSLPDTVRSFSGGGGQHIFFKYPGKELRGRIGMRPGVDIRAEDMNCVMPPSKHKSGGRYQWQPGKSPDEIEIAALPHWLLRMIQTKNAPQKRVKRVWW